MIIDSEFICHFYGAIRLIGLAAKINTIGDRCHHVVVVLLVWCEESHFVIENIGKYELGLFGTLKLALALQFIVTNAYFSVARTLTLVLHATLK